jgi:hypothetical protein
MGGFTIIFSWHDSFIAENGGIYANLESVYETTGGKAAVDSAFSRSSNWEAL